ncbi:endonuclease/exonuclease/phosphatase family protein [Flavobacteriaceae bacterium F89]|uniref:Endonuclease/exonuclease/phosphatase family protein n=1 Tax=Cerina litoralis TaxID=2874477 RepID=A0AAE3EUZ0_9FLAO|nr:endonuclease/exonuclease/phosphatase family protein [Cerina litoralis]MCG2461487.1 endonuclease/exonuclease/phosphatase family protein [Cerina litoralis]
MRKLFLYYIALFFFVFTLGCNSYSQEKEMALTEQETPKETKPYFDGTLKVLQLNIWQEGTEVAGGFDAIVDEVIHTGADIVALSEVRNYDDKSLATRLVNAMAEKGLVYYSKQSQDSGILSRFPIISQTAPYPPENDHGSITKAIINIAGTTVAFYSAHLDYTHYECYLPRGYSGVTWKKLPPPILDVDKILEQNLGSERDEAIAIFVADAKKEHKKGNLVLLGGDFNEPSHLDWTKATKDRFDHHGTVVPWNNSITLQENGFMDAYRVKYPDPVEYPGITWPANNIQVILSKLLWAKDADERDRIDFIYYHPDARLVLQDIVIVGREGCIVNGERIDTNPDREKFLQPEGIWPSDHKGVLAIFEIKSNTMS